MKSIYLRNFAVTALIVLLSFLLIAICFGVFGRYYFINTVGENLENSAEEVAKVASAFGSIDGLDGWSIGLTISSISESTGYHIFLTDPDGIVQSCSDAAPVCSHLGMSVPGRIMTEAVNGDGYVHMGPIAEVFDVKSYTVIKPIAFSNGGSTSGYAFVSCPMDNVLSSWEKTLSLVSFVCLGVFVIALAVSYVSSKKLAQPLDEIAAASRKFAMGDFTARVRQYEGPEYEIGALIDSFNKMADSLEKAEDRRSEFIANISHELRTPMTTISGFADGLLDGTIPQEEQKKYLTTISEETKRLARLVREMLDMSRMRSKAAEPANRTVFDMTELVLQVLLSFESRAMEKSLDVDPQFPDNHLLVSAEKDAITRVIYNLLDNAVKFAREESCIVLKLYKNEGKVYFSVKDEGETIPPDDLPFIFDRFHKSDRSRSLDKNGVGLGLYLVKTIINSHGEDIAVTSRDGFTEFVFTLPLADN